MINFLRIYNRSLVCTFNAVKPLCGVSITTNTYFRRSYNIFKHRNFLSLITAKKYNIQIAAMSMETIKTATYEDVKALKDNKAVLLIDVREPSELQQSGVLPGSINIPLGELEKILKNTPDDVFAENFGRPKPDTEFPLVFSCRSGKRSEDASIIAVKLGYKNVTNYGGGWLDWEKHLKQ